MTKAANSRAPWSGRRGRVLGVLSVLVALLLVFHSVVPGTPGHVGSLLETFLPWLGVAVPVVLVLAVLRRSYVALAATLLPAVAWLVLFGGLLLPGDDSPHTLTVLQHNVSDENPDPAGTVRTLLGADADLVALEELTPAALPAYEAALSADYPHRATQGTVGLWSKYPLSGIRQADIKPKAVGDGWDRGLRATARTAQGEVAVYVAHLPSVRLGLSGGFSAGLRDESAVLLGAALAAEPLDRVILLGDLNSTLDDRGLEPVASQLDGPASDFAFSWPAKLPLARIDQAMARSATVTRVWTLPATGSDHLPVAAHIRF
ncbi:endonuclease/exonuclease/phosphatase family protein [Streptomyces sp. NBC_01102]|uniref:endonuclease/exonuclease/phosphatase family protein n=1 Tax=unclassified Streptomyces TaxID=2593676 RepID=UPI00386E71FE|nr:endonuclease/exonuclease/phosphatase family protein [Streptomyces sp. NBC_01102]